ncbi:MAG TPA: hypothetical protein VJO53_10745 [Candidatus Acidoferrales bacterium]|nr:hypothetical protein [Candidatus Acidoferrales bacterium]
MKMTFRFGLSIPLLAFTIAQPALGYEYPLSSEAVREAYFLGKGSFEKKQAFFQKYKHNLPVPKTGADVALIQVETPFACLVDAVALAPETYHAQEAEQDFLGKPGQFRVHVEIYFTPSYPRPNDTAATLGDFWRDFTVRLKQRAEIPARAVHGRPIYSDDTISGYIGATIDLEYDVTKIDPGASTTIEVDTPDGQQVETTFELNNYR